jgi:small subunit ribosomal protein S1
VELALVERAISAAGFAGADGGHELTAEVGHHQSVVRTVGDEQALALLIGEHLAGKEEGRVAALAILGEVKPDRFFVEGLLLPVFFDELADDCIEQVVVPLSGRVADEVAFRIDQDEKKGERIGLSVRALVPRPEPKAGPAAPARPAPPPPPKAGDVVEATVDKIESFGLFVRFAGGRGLVPASETGTPRGADLRKAFKVGEGFQALVLAIDEQHRIRLSKTGAEEAAERKEAQEYMKAAAPKSGGKGFGTLGDLLREKLNKK